VGATRVAIVDVLGAKLTLDRSLARVSTLSAYPEVPARREARVAVVVSSARLTTDRSLAREPASSACPEAPAGREASPSSSLERGERPSGPSQGSLHRQPASERQPGKCYSWRGRGCSISVSSSEKDSGGDLSAPPLAWGADVDVLPLLGETVVGVGAVSGWEEYHVVVDAKGHELKTPKMDHRPKLERL
jgi:hypothetical protein